MRHSIIHICMRVFSLTFSCIFSIYFKCRSFTCGTFLGSFKVHWWLMELFPSCHILPLKGKFYFSWNQWMLAYQWRVRTMLHGVSEWEGRFEDVSRVLLCCASWEGQLRYFLIVDQLCWLCRPPVSNSMEHLKLCVRAGSTQGLSCSWYTHIHNIKLLKLRTQLIHTLSKLWFGACSVCVFSLSQQLWKLIRTHILYHLGLGWRF